jgi:adenine phosphoribosyltransferase
MNLEEKIHQTLIDVPDFPRPGILFKDITPLFQNPSLVREMVATAKVQLLPLQVDVVVGLESRGFPLGCALAMEMNLPFVMIRKKGKLPRPTLQYHYDLEYGQATVEIQKEDIKAGQRVFIHDDLLATGGTAAAAAALIQEAGGIVAGFGFIVTLDFLTGKEKLNSFGVPVHTFARVQ